MTTTSVKLVAKSRVKFGGKGDMTPVGFVRTEAATEVEPGKEFTCDSDVAEQLVASGAAMSPSDYEAEQRANKTSEERLRDLKDQIAEEDIATKARAGDPAAIISNTHLANQAKEEAAIEAAQKAEKSKGKTSADEEEPKAKAKK